MSLAVYCGAPKECTPADIKRVDNLFQQLGINFVFLHSECCLSTQLEFSAETIQELEERWPNRSNFPLQPNSFYGYMSLEEGKTPSATKHPIVRLLEQPLEKKKPAKALLPTQIQQERDFKSLEGIKVVKSIVFLDEGSQKEIGWYNQAANILWMCDMFHLVAGGTELLKKIVEIVKEYKRYGRLSEILMIGADPEFELINQDGDLISAYKIFGTREDRSIGFDGHAETGEIRPAPDRSPLGLSRNIKRLLRKMNNLSGVSDMQVWVGGGIHVSTGGHIHFNLKKFPPALAEILYDLVAEPVLKYQSDYRKKNEVRNWKRGGEQTVREGKEHGGCEWRVLPSFIVNQETTEAVLCTTYAITKSFHFHEYRREQGKAKKDDYLNIPLYSAFKLFIDKFVELFIANRSGDVLYRRDLLKEWNISALKKEATVDIACPTEWMGAFFTPVNVKLLKPVRIMIQFAGDTISTFGISQEYLDPLIELGRKCFLPSILVNEKLPQREARPTIYLPAYWINMTDKDLFCQEFKTALQKIIVKMGGTK